MNSEKDRPVARISYEKPTAVDLGPTAPVVGASCARGNLFDGSDQCEGVGNSATYECFMTGNSAAVRCLGAGNSAGGECDDGAAYT